MTWRTERALSVEWWVMPRPRGNLRLVRISVFSNIYTQMARVTSEFNTPFIHIHKLASNQTRIFLLLDQSLKCKSPFCICVSSNKLLNNRVAHALGGIDSHMNLMWHVRDTNVHHVSILFNGVGWVGLGWWGGVWLGMWGWQLKSPG